MNITEEKACNCALGHIFGFEPRISIALITHFGSASEVFKTGRDEIDKLLGPHSKHRGKITKEAVEAAAEELYTLSKQGISFIGWNEEEYPNLLKECEDAPIGIYIRSDSSPDKLWKHKRLISIVGTRDISQYGQDWCERLIIALSKCKEKPTIVSGLALGTDICAHKTAINCGLSTLAIMATGPAQVYPNRHKYFAEILTHTPGCALITDYPPGTPPLAIHFLRRNRIIAGISDSTILIESKNKGGGMNTARLAFSYNRDVYTLPGRVDDLRSQGCNSLIKEKIAEPIVSIDSFIESLRLDSEDIQSGTRCITDMDLIEQVYGNNISPNDIDAMCAMLIEIRNNRGITIEEISINTGLDYSNTSRLIAILEAEDFITTDLLQRCSINVKNV